MKVYLKNKKEIFVDIARVKIKSNYESRGPATVIK